MVSNSPPPPPLTQTSPKPSLFPIREVSRESLGGGASIASTPPVPPPSLRSLREVVLDPDPEIELDSAGVTVLGVDSPLATVTGAGVSVLECIGEVDVEASLELVADAGVDSRVGVRMGIVIGADFGVSGDFISSSELDTSPCLRKLT